MVGLLASYNNCRTSLIQTLLQCFINHSLAPYLADIITIHTITVKVKLSILIIMGGPYRVHINKVPLYKGSQYAFNN